MNKSHLVGKLLNSIHDARSRVYKNHEIFSEETYFSNMPVILYQSARLNIPRQAHLYQHRRDMHKCRTITLQAV